MNCPSCGVEIGGKSFGGLTLDVEGRELSRDGTVIPLTRLQFELMSAFMDHPGQVLSRSQLYERVWGYNFGDDSNTLSVALSTLRRKLGKPAVIDTVRGVGYVLRRA